MGEAPFRTDWPIVGVVLFAYLALFVVREGTSVTPLGVLVASLVGIGVGFPVRSLWKNPPPSGNIAFDPSPLSVLPAFLILSSLALYFGGYTFRLVHAGAGSVWGELEDACRRLFIQQENDRWAMRLSAKGPTKAKTLLTGNSVKATVEVIPLGRWITLLVLPRVHHPPKLILFFDWLSKRYPGPLPRFRMNLDRR